MFSVHHRRCAPRGVPLTNWRTSYRVAALALLAVGVASAYACASAGKTSGDAESHAARVLPPASESPPTSDGMPTGFSAAFANADSRARTLLYYQQCSANVTRLRAAGAFGPAANAPRIVHCERNADGLPLGGVFDVDTGYTKARRLTMIRLDGARPRYTGPLDTVSLARSARMVRDVTREIAAAARTQGRSYFVAPFTRTDGTLEGWALPQSTRGSRSAVLGGDMAFVRESPTALRRTIDHSATWKLITVPAAGPVRLSSAERDVPAVSDLALARGFAERGRDVVVTTGVASSALVPGLDPSGSRYRWEHKRAMP